MRSKAAWVVAVWLCWGASARAERVTEPKAAALSWVRLPGAERCPDQRALACQVNAHLQRSAFVEPSEAHLLIEASAEPTPTGAWKIRIALSDDVGAELGTRELLIEKPNCAEALDAAALAIALMIDPDASLRSEQPAPVPPRAEPQALQSRPPTPDEQRAQRQAAPVGDSVAAAREPTPWRSRLSLGAIATAGVLPGIAPGVFGALRLSPPSRSWGFELEGAYLPAQSSNASSSRGQGRFSLTSAELLGWIAPWRRGTFSLALLTGFEAGSVRARGNGFTVLNQDAESWLLSARLELELSWRFAQRWSLLLRPALGIPVRNERFDANVYGRTSKVFEPSPVTGSLTFGVGLEP